MNKFQWSILSYTLSTGLGLASGLPHIDASKCASAAEFKAVETPKKGEFKKLDNGYYMDEECKTLFVAPPTTGDISIASFAGNVSDLECNDFNHNEDMITMIQAKEKQAFADDNVALVDQLKDLKNGYKEDNREASVFEGYTMQTLISTKWTQLVSEYQKLNEGNYIVKPLPVIGSVLSTTVYSGKSDTDLILSDDTRTYHALLKSQLLGVNKLPANSILSFGESDIEGMAGFKGSASGQMVLSLAGTCPYYEIFNQKQESSLTIDELNKKKKKGPKSSATAHMVSNLTYYFPLTTRSTYTIKADFDGIVKYFEKKFVEKDIFNVKSILEDEEFKKVTQSIEYVSNEDAAGNGVDQQDKDDVKENFKESVVIQALAEFGKLVSDAPDTQEVAHPDGTQTLVRKECSSKKVFGIKVGSSCRDVAYTVTGKVTSDQSTRFKSKLQAHYSGTATNNKVYIQTGTMAFTDKE